MRAVRAASVEEIADALSARLARMASLGVTTVECKSGYGLDEAGDAVDDAIATDLAAVSPDLGERHLHTRAVTMAARELKERLSFAEEQTVLVTGEPPLPASYRRTELEQQIEPQVQRATRLAQAAVRAGRARELFQQDGPTSIRQQPWEELAGSVEHVLLSGGTSAIPAMPRPCRTSLCSIRSN